MKLIRPRYDPETGNFLRLYETVGFIIVRGDSDKVFLNYGFKKQKPGVSYSYCKRKILNGFSGTIFNRHCSILESGERESDMSHLYFFIPAVIHRSKTINQHMNNLSLAPIDMEQSQFNVWADNSSFGPSHLNISGLDKSVATKTMVKFKDHVVKVSNYNLVRKADELPFKREVDVPIEWIGKSSNRISS